MPFDDILDRHLDTHKPTYQYEILVKGSDYESCEKRALLFFQRYQLVRFSDVTIQKGRSVHASNQEFHERLREATRENRKILDNLIRELQEEKVETLEDLHTLPQGYKTKLLHVITHFLDGFFGIDTHFYNLVEDSHWVSAEIEKSIREAPSNFWLISLDARI